VVRGILLGLAVGLAQNAKYNGVLSGAIIAAAWAVGLVRPENRGQGPLLRTIAFGGLAVIVAAACYWPWYAFTEAHGGNSALLRHHRGYFDGPSRWLTNAMTQRAQMIALSGRLAGQVTWLPAAWAVAALACLASTRGSSSEGAQPTRRRSDRRLIVLTLFLMITLGADAPWWLGLSLAPWLAVDPSPSARVTGCALLAFSALVPLYHPYARLALPITALSWLTGAAWIRIALTGDRPSSAPAGDLPRRLSDARIPAVQATAAFLLIACHLLQRPSAISQYGVLGPRDGLRRAAAAIASQIDSLGPSRRTAVRVYGRPPLLWYLAEAGVAVSRAPSLDQIAGEASPGDVAVVDSLQAHHNAPALDLEARLSGRWWLYRISEGTASLVALLDANPGLAFSDSGTRAPRDPVTDLVYLLVPRSQTEPRSQPRRGQP
jgi:hypothetical protein